ncbi:MAG: SIR2 family protein [Solirubrobacteraceae bacterium]
MADVQTSDAPSPGEQAAPVKVFINYRREDAEEAAVRLYERLSSILGAENVYLDLKSIPAGTDFMAQIKAEGAKGSVFLALIGRRWLASLEERDPLRPGDAPDYVQLELELALNKWPGEVIPVLVGGAAMPPRVKLPKTIRRLASINASALRPLSFDSDVDTLVSNLATAQPSAEVQEQPAPATEPLESSGASAGPRPPDPTVVPAGSGSPAPSVAPPGPEPPVPTVAAPEDAHYEAVLDYMIREGSVVPVLGAGVRGSIPDAEQLAAHLAQTFRIALASEDLAEVAQQVEVTVGPAFLEKAILEALTPQPDPNAVHRFLASFPRRLREMGGEERYQMIVTANYDSALEQAFEEAGEDYDLAVFLAAGTDGGETNRGRFLHVRAEGGEPEPVGDPSGYRGFKISRFDELARTLIVKIHGSAEGGEGGVRWDGNYVLTEDQYIDYLVNDQIVRLIPFQILNKLKKSHCLFLGYAIRDWSRRVFLKRVWGGDPLRNSSWAVERAPDQVEKDAWKALQVELFRLAPDVYVGELEARIASRTRHA